MGERVLTGCLMLFAAVFFAMAMRIPDPHVDTPLAGAFWPAIALVILFVCSSIEMIRLLRESKAEREAQARAKERKIAIEQEATGERFDKRLLIFGGFISFFYIILLYYMGFTIVTPLLMAIYMWATGYRKRIGLAAIPIATIAVFLLLFVVFTYIPLPRGIGIFKEISVLIY